MKARWGQETDPQKKAALQSELDACQTSYAATAPLIYGKICPSGLAAVPCMDPNNIDDTPMCDSGRAGMPFIVTVAPLEENGNVASGLRGGCAEQTCPADPNDPFCEISSASAKHSITCTPTHGSRRYSFALVPQKLYVPTEAESASKGLNPNTLSLFHEGALKTDPEQLRLVLELSEGAYVEGVIRFEQVTAPLTIAKRKPRAP